MMGAKPEARVCRAQGCAKPAGGCERAGSGGRGAVSEAVGCEGEIKVRLR